jgi:hypothetical protein
VLRGKALMAGTSPAMTTWRLGRPARTAFAGHVGILETHRPTEVAKFPRLIVIGFRPNLV